MKVFDDRMSIGKEGFSYTEERKEGWLDGEVATPWGFVRAYAQGDKIHTHHTRLDFIWNGVMYMRNFNGKRYSKRGIKTKAMHFAREIAETNTAS